MNLGELITALEACDPAVVLAEGFGRPCSWRGSYDELAFEPAQNVTVGSMLDYARSAAGASFDGYKGGLYTMDLGTPCHVAAWGEYGGDDDALTTWRLSAMLARPAIAVLDAKLGAAVRAFCATSTGMPPVDRAVALLDVIVAALREEGA